MHGILKFNAYICDINTEKLNDMISPMAYVDPKARIGENVTIHPFAYVDADTVVGDGCEIMPYASIMHGTTLEAGVKVYQGAIVGADPQDFRWKGAPTRCSIGARTVIRENVIINRSITPEGLTRIGEDCYLMAGSHVAHDSYVAARCVVGNAVNIAGDVVVESGTILSSNVVVHERSRIGKFVLIKGGTRISGNVPPYIIMAHNPARYYGINTVLLRKHAGFSEEQIDDIAKAYRHIYQCSTSVFNALQRIETDIDPSDIRSEIVDFVRRVDHRIVGNREDLLG